MTTYGGQRPWLVIGDGQDPLVRHVYCERDRAGGHDPARHDGWRDGVSQEQRAAAAKDPAHPSDTPAYDNSVDHFIGVPPADGIGGARKQHTPGEHTSWISDPVAWAIATVRAMKHPDVQRALAAEKLPPNVQVPLQDVLGPEGHRACDGYTLITKGFSSAREAKYNRDGWVSECREVMRAEGVNRDQAEALVERMARSGRITWVKPEVSRIESFEGGTCQINLRHTRNNAGVPVPTISTIFYNPPMDARDPA